MNNARREDGWFHSFRRISDSVVGLVQNRIELFSVELQEEKLRAFSPFSLIVSLVIALALGVAGFLVGLGALAIYLWDTAGYFGLIGLALVTLAAAVGVLWGIRRQIQKRPPLFAETISEFKKDRACLRQTE